MFRRDFLLLQIFIILSDTCFSILPPESNFYDSNNTGYSWDLDHDGQDDPRKAVSEFSPTFIDRLVEVRLILKLRRRLLNGLVNYVMLQRRKDWKLRLVSKKGITSVFGK